MHTEEWQQSLLILILKQLINLKKRKVRLQLAKNTQKESTSTVIMKRKKKQPMIQTISPPLSNMEVVLPCVSIAANGTYKLKSVTWFKSDWAAFHMLKTPQQAKAEGRCSEVQLFTSVIKTVYLSVHYTTTCAKELQNSDRNRKFPSQLWEVHVYRYKN